ncbi:MAG: hypothetical protein J1E63_05365 [Muribaculaceae bacterium]|nr:hypothetical protein [Muribaculaceae bacterium]
MKSTTKILIGVLIAMTAMVIAAPFILFKKTDAGITVALTGEMETIDLDPFKTLLIDGDFRLVQGDKVYRSLSEQLSFKIVEDSSITRPKIVMDKAWAVLFNVDVEEGASRVVLGLNIQDIFPDGADEDDEVKVFIEDEGGDSGITRNRYVTTIDSVTTFLDGERYNVATIIVPPGMLKKVEVGDLLDGDIQCESLKGTIDFCRIGIVPEVFLTFYNCDIETLGIYNWKTYSVTLVESSIDNLFDFSEENYSSRGYAYNVGLNIETSINGRIGNIIMNASYAYLLAKKEGSTIDRVTITPPSAEAKIADIESDIDSDNESFIESDIDPVNGINTNIKIRIPYSVPITFAGQ